MLNNYILVLANIFHIVCTGATQSLKQILLDALCGLFSSDIILRIVLEFSGKLAPVNHFVL